MIARHNCQPCEDDIFAANVRHIPSVAIRDVPVDWKASQEPGIWGNSKFCTKPCCSGSFCASEGLRSGRKLSRGTYMGDSSSARWLLHSLYSASSPASHPHRHGETYTAALVESHSLNPNRNGDKIAGQILGWAPVAAQGYQFLYHPSGLFPHAPRERERRGGFYFFPLYPPLHRRGPWTKSRPRVLLNADLHRHSFISVCSWFRPPSWFGSASWGAYFAAAGQGGRGKWAYCGQV